MTTVQTLDASAPVEASGLTRDQVRLLVGRRGSGEVSHHAFTDLPTVLREPDVLVVNTSATLPAAVAVPDTPLVVHFSTPWTRPTSSVTSWLVEVRRDGLPYSEGAVGQCLPLSGGGAVILRSRYSAGRLWVADLRLGGLGVVEYLKLYGRPIRYGYVPHAWGLEYYQTVFAREPGSAEMPSAGRPFTDALVTRLVTSGVAVVPILLHTGVASPEAHERPYPERFAVSATTAATINHRRRIGGRVVAVGTTVVRALESAVTPAGAVRAASGVTSLVITPSRGVRVVDALLTGLHEPKASHLDMLEAVAGRPLLDACYAAAHAGSYRWHEFGDLNLLLP